MSLQNLKYLCLRSFVNFTLLVRRSSWVSPATQPNETQTLNGRHDLFPARVFRPAGTDPDRKLPLVICVHGGGFLLNNPSSDDPLARYLSDNAECLVVSIDYRKSPQSKFPSAYEDVVEQTCAILESTGFHIDPDRAVLLGSSAGGNLVLAAAQHPSLRGRLRGVIALYPVCDMAPSTEEKMATRPDESVPDFLGGSYTTALNLYLPESRSQVSFQDPRLSPTHYLSRDHLPPDVLLVGVEHDLLCHEAEAMADKLAAEDKAAKSKEANGWQAGHVRWYKVKGQPHAFDHFAAKTSEDETTRQSRKDDMYALFCDWLKNVNS